MKSQNFDGVEPHRARNFLTLNSRKSNFVASTGGPCDDSSIDRASPIFHYCNDAVKQRRGWGFFVFVPRASIPTNRRAR